MEEIDRQHLQLALKASNTGVWLWLVKERRAIFCSIVRSLFLSESEDVPTELLARRFYEAVHPDDVSSLKKAMIDAETLGTPYEIEYRLLNPDGLYRFVYASGKPVFDLFGNAVSVQGVLRDITSEKLHGEQSKRLAILEERNEFAAMLAHDLRLPIQGTQMILPKLIEAFANGDYTVNSGELLQRISSGNEGLLLMIDNLIDTYRVELKSRRLRICRFDLRSLVEECVDDFAPLARLSDVTISADLVNLYEALGDRYASKRILSNLLSNAVKYNRRQGSILVKGRTFDNRAEVFVIDSGCGISKKDVDELFLTFWRTGRKYRGYGMGMGLYLCKKLVDMQDGTISCTSCEGIGSIFKVCLPTL